MQPACVHLFCMSSRTMRVDPDDLGFRLAESLAAAPEHDGLMALAPIQHDRDLKPNVSVRPSRLSRAGRRQRTGVSREYSHFVLRLIPGARPADTSKARPILLRRHGVVEHSRGELYNNAAISTIDAKYNSLLCPLSKVDLDNAQHCSRVPSTATLARRRMVSGPEDPNSAPAIPIHRNSASIGFLMLMALAPYLFFSLHRRTGAAHAPNIPQEPASEPTPF